MRTLSPPPLRGFRDGARECRDRRASHRWPETYFIVAVEVNVPSLALLANRLSPYEMSELVPSLNNATMKLFNKDERLTYAFAPCETTTAHWLFVSMQSSTFSCAVGP